MTLGLAPGRPSHVPVMLNVRARRRCPIHPLACARCTSPIMRRVRTAKVYRYAHDGAASRRGRGECEVPPLEIGVRTMQLSPYRAGLAGRHGTRLPVPPAFPTGSCPLWLSPSGQSMTQESPFELLLTVSRIQLRVPRRTVSLHPAQASQRPCEETRQQSYNLLAARYDTEVDALTGKVAPVAHVHRHLQHLLYRFLHSSRAETPQGSLPACASGDVARTPGATRILPITRRPSLFPTPLPAPPVVGLMAFLPFKKERYGLTTFRKVDTDG